MKNVYQKNLSEIIDLIYSNYASLNDKKRWGDKTPKYIHHVPLLLQLFPHAKIIHLIRDGRDVVGSQIKSFKKNHFYERALNWKNIIQKHQQYLQQFNLNRYQHYFYEDLIQLPEQTLKNICHFIEEPFESSMLNFYHNQQLQTFVQNKPHHQNIQKPIQPQSIGKYHERLSKKQIEWIEYLCEEELKINTLFESHQVKKPNFLIIKSIGFIIMIQTKSIILKSNQTIKKIFLRPIYYSRLLMEKFLLLFIFKIKPKFFKTFFKN